MKKYLYASIMLLCSCADMQHGTNEENLKRFYKWYFSESTGYKTRFSVGRDTLERYCSESFLMNSFNDSALDYDPLVSADNYTRYWATNIIVGRLEDSRVKMYRISFQTDKQFHTHNIAVTMAKQDGEWKIDYVKDIK